MACLDKLAPLRTVDGCLDLPACLPTRTVPVYLTLFYHTLLHGISTASQRAKASAYPRLAGKAARP
jgi:hypothetical protein